MIKTKIYLKLFIILFIILFITKNQNDDINNTNITNHSNNTKNITSKTKIKVALCTIAKKENRYIKFFVDIYKRLGYDHIYFFDNNEKGDESIDDVQIVKDGIKEGYISIINYKDKKPNIKTVVKSYYDCYERYGLEYDWISFFDIDEYLILEPKGGSTIQEFLENPRFKVCDNIKINWRVFNDNDQLDFEDKPLMERFPIETNYRYENRHVKSTIRGKLNYKNFKRNYSPHSIWSNLKTCSASGKRTNGPSPFLWPPDTKIASLNHYVTKSVREFFSKKYKNKVDVDTIPKKKKDYLFNYFFKINKKTKQKVDIFNQMYHTNYT